MLTNDQYLKQINEHATKRTKKGGSSTNFRKYASKRTLNYDYSKDIPKSTKNLKKE